MILENEEAIKFIEENSKYFKPKEFMCNCGCKGIKIETDNITRLNAIRDAIGIPIIITSAYRCVKHNKKVGGVSSSYHVQGRATDITVKNFTEHKDFILVVVESTGFTGVGKNYSTFIHVDDGIKRSW